MNDLQPLGTLLGSAVVWLFALRQLPTGIYVFFTKLYNVAPGDTNLQSTPTNIISGGLINE
jgi:hypothetical protein